jgi:hypothetical protein
MKEKEALFIEENFPQAQVSQSVSHEIEFYTRNRAVVAFQQTIYNFHEIFFSSENCFSGGDGRTEKAEVIFNVLTTLFSI